MGLLSCIGQRKGALSTSSALAVGKARQTKALKAALKQLCHGSAPVFRTLSAFFPIRAHPLPAAMKFRFPIVIIDEDFRSENTSGLGIRALADAIEGEGYEVMGVTSYGDLSQFAQQQSRASAFILSIDDEEFTPGPDLDPAVMNLRDFIQEVRRKNTDVPIYVYGETKTSRHLPNDILRELHGFFKGGFRLTGKADNEVGRNCGHRAALTDAVHHFAVLGNGVLAFHGQQHLVTT
jgi:hypothetical protein